MAKKYQDFDEADQDGFFDQILNIVSRHKRGFAILSVVAAVVLLGVIVLGSYPEDEQTAATESVPIVRADAGEYKTTPENPGGMEIPYRDSTVFSGDTEGGTENILADETTEEPVPRSQLFAGLNTEGDQPGGAPADEAAPDTAPATGGEVEATQAELAKAAPVEAPSNDALVKEAIGVPPSEEPLDPETAQIAAATIPEAAKSATVEAPAPEAKEAAKIESAAGTTQAKGVEPGGSYVQLASVKSESAANAEWKKLQAKYSSLSGVDFRTQKASLPKGTFYRIQAGPMSKDSAVSICNEIKKKTPGGCLIVTK
jgi:hypothetical protein